MNLYIAERWFTLLYCKAYYYCYDTWKEKWEWVSTAELSWTDNIVMTDFSFNIFPLDSFDRMEIDNQSSSISSNVLQFPDVPNFHNEKKK